MIFTGIYSLLEFTKISFVVKFIKLLTTHSFPFFCALLLQLFTRCNLQMLTIAAFRLHQFSRIFFVVRSGLFTVCFGAIFNLIRQWILSDREKQVICIISITIKNFLDIFTVLFDQQEKILPKQQLQRRRKSEQDSKEKKCF